jgi:alpha-galactosidase
VSLIECALLVALTLTAASVVHARDERSAAREWASAALLGQGSTEPGTDLETKLPFSFVYNGKPSADLLGSWKRTAKKERARSGKQRHIVTYADPATGLEVICEATVFMDFPAVEWILRFRNSGTGDTPLIENILPLDLGIAAPSKDPVVFHHEHGSTAEPTDFLPIREPVAPGSEIRLAPSGGRSSNGVMPFFNLELGSGGGIAGAVGWSGQWQMRLSRTADRLSLQAGQQTIHLKLHPGESIRTPRILLVMWQGGDALRGNNLLRRLVLAHYTPRYKGKVVVPPITLNAWFTFNGGNDVTEENQLEVIRRITSLGLEGFWLDAGWFEGGWPRGAGSWVPKKEAFPRGLKPLADAAHQRGMKFVVWFEPERVDGSSRIWREHPEFVLKATEEGLFNLGDPAARRWLTDLLSKCIADWGIDIYRNDFNMDPLPFWQAADAPDRQGITEIRYIEGLYEMWDELLRRHPGLAIDNCSSGGRRIDLETISRSFALTRSDTIGCARPLPAQDQVQSAGLSLYVPLHSSGVWTFDPYCFRSVATTGTTICPNPLAKEFPMAQAKQAIEEIKALRDLWLGDYYPLTDINTSERDWCAWQFDRPEQGRGFAMFFRRSESPDSGMVAGLRGLDPKARYEVSFAETYDVKKTRVMTGEELGKLRVEIGSAPGSLVVTYRRADE